jgi:hypothetical protein
MPALLNQGQRRVMVFPTWSIGTDDLQEWNEKAIKGSPPGSHACGENALVNEGDGQVSPMKKECQISPETSACKDTRSLLHSPSFPNRTLRIFLQKTTLQCGDTIMTLHMLRSNDCTTNYVLR